MDIYTEEDLHKFGIKTHVLNLNYSRLSKYSLKNKRMTRKNIDTNIHIAFEGLIDQFNIHLKEQTEYMTSNISIASICISEVAYNDYKDYYEKLFRSKFFSPYKAVWTLNMEPKIISYEEMTKRLSLNKLNIVGANIHAHE